MEYFAGLPLIDPVTEMQLTANNVVKFLFASNETIVAQVEASDSRFWLRVVWDIETHSIAETDFSDDAPDSFAEAYAWMLEDFLLEHEDFIRTI